MTLLKAEHITKKYSGRTIIEDISINLQEGELVSLLGVSGAGKTTLFHVLSGLVAPEEGPRSSVRRGYYSEAGTNQLYDAEGPASASQKNH